MFVGLDIRASGTNFPFLSPCTEEQAEDVRHLAVSSLPYIDIEAEAWRCETRVGWMENIEYFAAF